jgi:hypothetical protein
MDSHLYNFNNLMYELLLFFNKEDNNLEDDIIEYYLYRYK